MSEVVTQSAVPTPETLRPIPHEQMLLTVAEVAAILRTSKKAVYSMADRRQIPGVTRIGRRVLVRRDKLIKFLDQKCALSPKE